VDRELIIEIIGESLRQTSLKHITTQYTKIYENEVWVRDNRKDQDNPRWVIVRLEGSTLRVENGRPPAVSINLADPEGIWKLGNAIHEALRTTMLFASRL
jgi:hypothetical protein